MNAKKRIGWLAPALLIGATLAEAGGDIRMYGAGEIPQASEVADILSGGAAQMKRPKMRGISLDTGYKAPDKVQESLQEIAQPKSTVIGVPVEFAFNSADILPENKPQLDAVAEGIKMTNGLSVVVEGHTDAHGAESYNQRLSRMRAQAVRNYLVRKHGISSSKLVIEGMGENAPINSADPFAPENRRVQFRAAK